jgi:hypothetical protein
MMNDPSARRDVAAEVLLEAVTDNPLPDAAVDAVARAAAEFHLRLYDNGVDLDVRDDAATVCAVILALSSLSSAPKVGLVAGMHSATAAYDAAARR